MDYVRCSAHGLMNCMLCSAAKPAVPKAAVEGAIVVTQRPPGWSPEDELSGSSASSVAIPDGPDKQALEAIERQKEILLKREVELNSVDTILVEGPKERLNTSMGEGDGRRLEKALLQLSQPRAVDNRSPLMEAAALYDEAERTVTKAVQRVEDAEVELKNAQRTSQAAAEARDVKKQLLKKLME